MVMLVTGKERGETCCAWWFLVGKRWKEMREVIQSKRERGEAGKYVYQVNAKLCIFGLLHLGRHLFG